MSLDSTLTDVVWDVTVIGAGPVGQSLALLLADEGHRVLLLDKQDAPYPLPRAVHFTPDVSRLLDRLGVMEAVNEFAHEAKTYDWQTADRQTMISFRATGEEQQGWPWSTMFNQPGLEKQLLRRIAEEPRITLAWSAEVTGITQGPDEVVLEVTSGTSRVQIRTAFAIGCDGANSFVRGQIDTVVNDLGFFYDWLVIDFDELIPREWEPENLQICDPERPVSVVSSGPGKRRFEFMRTEKDRDDFVTEESCWRLVSPWGVTPETASLERFRLYTFQARWASNWFDGRVGIAGDAAHQVPPFFGVGMVSGMRDATNLAWKLDLVQRGKANKDILDSYTSERGVEIQNTIGMSVELGKVICELDPERVAARDAHFLATGPNPQDCMPPVPPERLGPGILFEDLPLDAPWTGVLSVNEKLEDATGAVTLMDRLNYGGFTLIADADRVSVADAELAATAAAPELNLLVIRVTAGNTSLDRLTDAGAGKVVTLRDVTGVLTRHLQSAGYSSELIRPDFVVFGGHDSPRALVDKLGERICS